MSLCSNKIGRVARLNPLIVTLKPQSSGPLYNNTVIGTLAVDGWTVTFGTARRGLVGAAVHPGPSSLYRKIHETVHQRTKFILFYVAPLHSKGLKDSLISVFNNARRELKTARGHTMPPL